VLGGVGVFFFGRGQWHQFPHFSSPPLFSGGQRKRSKSRNAPDRISSSVSRGVEGGRIRRLVSDKLPVKGGKGNHVRLAFLFWQKTEQVGKGERGETFISNRARKREENVSRCRITACGKKAIKVKEF